MKHCSEALLGLFLLGVALGAARAQDSKVPLPAGHGVVYCNTFETQCRNELSIIRERDSLKTLVGTYQSGKICTASCKSTADSLNGRIASLQKQVDSISALRQQPRLSPRTSSTKPRSTGGPAPSAVRRSVSPSRQIVVGKEQAIIRPDTVYLRFRDTVTMRDTVVVERVDSLVIVQHDTLKIREVEFRNAKGFPVWRTAGAVAGIAAVACAIASHQFGHSAWDFNCFGSDVNVSVTNTNNNGTPFLGSRFRFQIRP